MKFNLKEFKKLYYDNWSYDCIADYFDLQYKDVWLIIQSNKLKCRSSYDFIKNCEMCSYYMQIGKDEGVCETGGKKRWNSSTCKRFNNKILKIIKKEKIEKRIKPIIIKNKCPECNQKLEKYIYSVQCTNEKCNYYVSVKEYA